jgi:hypothetical protein
MWRLRHSLAICLSNLDVSISTSQKIKREKVEKPNSWRKALWQNTTEKKREKSQMPCFNQFIQVGFPHSPPQPLLPLSLSLS